MSDVVTIMADGISVDLLLYRRWGERGQTLVESTLALNPGLAACGPLLPRGTQVRLPKGPARAIETARAVDLFS